jgi:hypothetical protein
MVGSCSAVALRRKSLAGLRVYLVSAVALAVALCSAVARLCRASATALHGATQALHSSVYRNSQSFQVLTVQALQRYRSFATTA